MQLCQYAYTQTGNQQELQMSMPYGPVVCNFGYQKSIGYQWQQNQAYQVFLSRFFQPEKLPPEKGQCSLQLENSKLYYS